MTNTNMEFILDNNFGVGKNLKEDSYEVYIVNDDVTVSLDRAKVDEAATAARRDPFYTATLIATISEKQVILSEEIKDSLKKQIILSEELGDFLKEEAETETEAESEELIDLLKEETEPESEALESVSMREIIDFAISIMNITPEYSIRSLINIIEEIKGYEFYELLKGEKEIKEFFPGGISED